MYAAEINRRQPAFLLLLVDQSFSMSEPWTAGAGAKSDMLAAAVNRLLRNAVAQCSKGDDRILDYFEVGVVGYGADVNLALPRATPERPVLPISEVGNFPRRIDEIMRKIPDGAGGIIEAPTKVGVWLDPVANGQTPMREVFTVAEHVVSVWCDLHPSSFPPIVINLTDGASTDGDPSLAAAQLRSTGTNDGRTLLFNVHISGLSAAQALFPNTAAQLTDPHAAMLFAMSSELPSAMAESASSLGYPVQPNSRGFIYNGQVDAVVEFLDIGTRAVTGTKALPPGASRA